MYRLAAVAAIGVLALGGACTTRTTSISTPTATTAARSPEPSLTIAPATTGPGPTATTAASPRAVTGFVAFKSPTQNVVCDMTGEMVRCDVRTHSWSPPPKPSSCQYDWYGSLGLTANGTAQFLCVSDAVADGPVLSYGSAIRDGSIVCESSESGVQCTSQTNGHGFRVNRQTYTFY